MERIPNLKLATNGLLSNTDKEVLKLKLILPEEGNFSGQINTLNIMSSLFAVLVSAVFLLFDNFKL